MKYYKAIHYDKLKGIEVTRYYKYIDHIQHCYFKGGWYETGRFLTNLPDKICCGFSFVQKEELIEISEQEAFLELL